MSAPCAASATSTTENREHVDVVIVGAGISGIGAAYHLKTRLPGKTFVVLESRDAIGGTWDLFRYPGIRSDSDLHTFAYEFKPWTASTPSPTRTRSSPTSAKPSRRTTWAATCDSG